MRNKPQLCAEPECKRNSDSINKKCKCEGCDSCSSEIIDSCKNTVCYCLRHLRKHMLESDDRLKCVYCRDDVVVNGFGNGANEYTDQSKTV